MICASIKANIPVLEQPMFVRLFRLQDITMEETAAYARKLAERVGNELDIPVIVMKMLHLLLKDATWPIAVQANMKDFRKNLNDPHWKPDFGPAEFNPR